MLAKKTYNLNFPTKEQVPEEFINSFILGFFEGDGTIFKSAYNCKYKEKSYSYPCWNFGFVGTKNMLENIQIILNKMCDFPINKLLLDKRVSYDFYSLMYNASITDKNNKIERLHSYLYKDAIFVMKRKKKVLKKILKIKNKIIIHEKHHIIVFFSIEEYNRRYKILKENIDLSLVEVAKLIGIKDYTTISDMYKKWNIFRPGLKYSKNE